MNEFLAKLNLIKETEITFTVKKLDFVRQFTKQVDEDHVIFSDHGLEGIIKYDNKYVGEVKYDTFKIRRRKAFVERQSILPIIRGEFHQTDDKLNIKYIVDGFHFQVKLGIILQIIFFIALYFTLSNFNFGYENIILNTIFIISLISIGNWYLKTRSYVSRENDDLEKELVYTFEKITK